jgi:predicted DNA-binding antitoxin AbrB/MazE fold protein
MQTIPAIFEHGVFRPMAPVQLPEGTQVKVSAPDAITPPASDATMTEGMKRVYAILGERYSSGHADTAARHNEHQP